MTPNPHELLTGKQLAAALGRERTYISAMKRRGFEMPGGLATVAEAREWLARNPPPRSRQVFRAAA
jgi:hypothetical protein